MKKYLFTVVLAATQMVAIAQTVNVHFKNGQSIEYPSANVDYVDFSEKAPDPTVSAGAVVDLGLSVYWCSCNVGAESPEEYGDYFAWGETKPKNSYTQANYSYYNANTTQYIDIGSDISGTQYDAATANLGSDWRMPTKEEIKELVDKCTWEWTQINGINGYKVTGTNGNSIFIPAAGRMINSTLLNESESFFIYSASVSTIKSAMLLAGSSNLSKPYLTDFGFNKEYGLTIRPVTSNPNAQGGPVDHSNDNLVTDKISASFTGSSYSMINGRIMSGSVLNVKFTNSSTEAVTLTGIQIYDSGNTNKGNNLLSAEVEVAAGNNQSYGLTLGSSMAKPVVCFTYRYNKKKYTVEAEWSTPSF